MNESCNIAREFPRLFLPREYHAHDRPVPADILSAARARLEAALASLFRRMVMIYADPDGDGAFTSARVLPLLRKRLDAAGLTNVEIAVVGGALRAALAHLYEELWRSHRAGHDTASALDAVIADTRDIPEYFLRGIGSDFDLLVRAPCDAANNHARLIAYQTLSGATKRLNLHNERHPVHLAVFPLVDIRNDPPDRGAWTKIGGSACDYLEFDLRAMRLREVSPLQGVVDDFLSGEYADIVSYFDRALGQPLTLAMRALRSLVEIPFLRLRHEEDWRERLACLNTSLINGDYNAKDLAKAAKQLAKMAVNARLQAGNNRLIRADPGSLEHAIKGFLDLLADTAGVARFPEFEPTPTGCRQNWPHSEATIYYVAPDMSAALCLLRGNLTRAGEITHDRDAATKQAGSNGAVIPLAINSGAIVFPDDPRDMACIIAANVAEGRCIELDPVAVYSWIQRAQPLLDTTLDATTLVALRDKARAGLRQHPTAIHAYPWRESANPDDTAFLAEMLERHPGFSWDLGDLFFQRMAHTPSLPPRRSSKIAVAYFYALMRAIADRSLTHAPDQERILAEALQLSRTLFDTDPVPFPRPPSGTSLGRRGLPWVVAQRLVAEEFRRAVREYYDATPYFHGESLRPWQDPELMRHRRDLARFMTI